jgi:hypothetical protein
MLDALGGESETVIVAREARWLLGWVEWIAIHQDDEKSLEIADKIRGETKEEDYPVINDDHLAEVEQQEADKTWKNCYSPQGRIAYIRTHRSQFEFRDWRDLLDCVRGQLLRRLLGLTI